MTPRYEEWLTTVANTRLVYNTLHELEEMLEAPSIRTNGIKRCFVSEQRMRSAFRDLMVEVSEMTNDLVKLDVLLEQYRCAWAYYRDKLSRRTNPTDVALQLLTYYYRPDRQNEVSRRLLPLFEEIEQQKLDVSILVLLLCKAIPGYDSKTGDVEDIESDYQRVITLLDQFTSGGELFSSLPVINAARIEPSKTRLMLVYHVREILDTWLQYAEQENLYSLSQDLKASIIDLDIAGYWNACEGSLAYTDFWQVDEALNPGTFFATHWHKDAQDCITGTRYTLFLLEGIEADRLVAYVLHPEAIHTRMKGFAYDDRDHTWFEASISDVSSGQATLERRLPSEQWPQRLSLTRVTAPEVVAQYEQWLSECRQVKPFGHLEYVFRPSLYAITVDALYIPTDEGGYYRVPRDAFEGCDRIQMGDMVGMITMGGRQYLAFDEFLLYIPITRPMLERYHIRKVSQIE